MAVYDLSQPIADGMPVYPGSDPVRVEQASTLEAGARVTSLTLDTHVGTHVDAPSHIVADGRTLDEFSPSAFTFDALRVDCTGHDPRAPIGVADLPDPTDHDLLAIHTGYDDRWGTDAYRDHPYLDAAAARWCADHGYSVGLDAFSPDPTPSADPDRERPSEPEGYPAHDALLAADCLILENLAGLDSPPGEFTLRAVPLSIPGADGSPVRALAEA